MEEQEEEEEMKEEEEEEEEGHALGEGVVKKAEAGVVRIAVV